VAEVVKVGWQNPDDDIYYVSTGDEYILRNLPLEVAPLEIRLLGREFQDILNDTTIADDKVQLKLWDGDGAISDLANQHGSGQRVEIFYWFPQVRLLLSQWWGHMQPATEAGIDWYQCDAAVGFLSSMLPLPRRAFYTGCQALFGGLLKTQAEIDEGDCPYNRHLNAATTINPSSHYQNSANGTIGSNGAFSKSSGGDAWNCGVSYDVEITEGDASIDLTVSAGYTTVGFTNTASPINGNTDFLFGLQLNPAGDVTLRGVDAAHSWANAARWQAGVDATFRIEFRAGRFRAYKGSTEIAPVGYTAPAPSFPFWIGMAIFTSTGAISEAHVAIGDIGAAPSSGNLNPDTGLPFTECPRNRPACIARLGDDLNYLGFDTVIQSYTVGETKGPNITVTTRGNESNLKRPLRVIFGQRHVADLDLMAYTVEPDTNHPEGGAVACLFAECEGPIQEQANQTINGIAIGAMHLNARNGELRQSRTGFSVNVSNYSGTALFFGRAQGDFTKTSADQLRGEVDIKGLKDVRRYMDDGVTFIQEYSTDRAWALLHCLRHKRWGYGLDVERFIIQDWIDLAAWGQQMVTFTDVDGTAYNSQRTQFHAELIDRTVQQQINDICLAGRYTLPFADKGKLRIRPLGRATELFSPQAIIESAFIGALGRAATGGEYNTWATALIAARATSVDALITEAASLIAGLFGSSEYTALDRTDLQFVDDCYAAYLNRGPDTEGEANHLAIVIASGRTFDLGQFAGSVEFHNRIAGSPIPKFSDRGSGRNICVDDTQKTTLVRQIVSDDQVPNRVIVNFDDSAHNNAQRPLTFEDIGAQLRAGYASGDTSRRAVEKTYTALGVTDMGEAVRLGNLLLHLGDFDEGGTVNNLRVQFTTWFSECLTLRKYDLIEIDSAQIERYKEPIATASGTLPGTRPFQYFRVRSMRRLPNLKVEISAQAYPVDYYNMIESVVTPPPIIGTGGDAGGGIGAPFNVGLEDIVIGIDSVNFTIGATAI
jgi:hypothetical protein